MYHKLLVYTVINHPRLIKGCFVYQHILPNGSSGIDIPAGQILHHGKEMPGNPLLPLSVAIADEENVMADIAKPALTIHC